MCDVHHRCIGNLHDNVARPDAGFCSRSILQHAGDDDALAGFDIKGFNFNLALQASCSIPFLLKAVHNIPGAHLAPTGMAASLTTTYT